MGRRKCQKKFFFSFNEHRQYRQALYNVAKKPSYPMHILPTAISFPIYTGAKFTPETTLIKTYIVEHKNISARMIRVWPLDFNLSYWSLPFGFAYSGVPWGKRGLLSLFLNLYLPRRTGHSRSLSSDKEEASASAWKLGMMNPWEHLE